MSKSAQLISETLDDALERLAEARAENTRLAAEVGAANARTVECEAELMGAVAMLRTAEKRANAECERAARAEGALDGERTARAAAEANLATEREMRSALDARLVAAIGGMPPVMAPASAPAMSEFEVVPVRGKSGKALKYTFKAMGSA